MAFSFACICARLIGPRSKIFILFAVSVDDIVRSVDEPWKKVANVATEAGKVRASP